MIKRSKKEVADLFLEQQKVDKYLDPVQFSIMLGYKSPSRLYRALNFYNIPYVRRDRNKNQSNYNKEVLYGNLLGDGFIYYSTKNSNYPIFSVEYKYLEYITYISKINPFLLCSIISRFPPTVVVITGTFAAKLSKMERLKHSM